MITVKDILSRTNFGYVLKIPSANNIICGFSTREFNYDFRADSSGVAYQEILRNRENFLESLNLNLDKSVFIEQVHESLIKEVTETEQGKGAYDYKNSIPGADAVITALTKTSLCILSADCLPLVFWHPQVKIIGIAHAGWRGLKERIGFKTVIRMQETYNCGPEKIKVFIGPGIRSCCYEVSRGFKEHFPGFVCGSKDRLCFDMVKAASAQLLEAGIVQENIIDSGLCTKCNNAELFSYRGQDQKKRMLSCVALK